RPRSLDSFIQLASGIVWGRGEGQLREPRQRRSRSPFTFTETQEMPHMCSPYPTISDNWDRLHHGAGPSVTELPGSPEPWRLPPPTSSLGGPAARSDGVGCSSAAKSSRKSRAASSGMEPAVTVPRESPVMSQSVNDFPTEPPLPPSPTDSRPSLAASQTTPTTPPDPPSDEEPGPLRQVEGSQEPITDACQGTNHPGGDPKPRGKRRLSEPEDWDLEHAPWIKRAREEAG
ncbi:hypothetical protein C8A05DRAFT_13804, partial [Staphylotrichum tortipilum]